MAASYEDDRAVVVLAESAQIYELFKDKISILGGGPYAYYNRATVTGSLGLVGEELVLSDVDRLDVYELRKLKLKPRTPLKKKA